MLRYTRQEQMPNHPYFSNCKNDGTLCWATKYALGLSLSGVAHFEASKMMWDQLKKVCPPGFSFGALAVFVHFRLDTQMNSWVEQSFL